MFEKLKTYFGMDAATTLAPPDVLKVKSRDQISLPSFLKTSKPTSAALPVQDRRLVNTDITAYRNGASTRVAMRDFIAASPDLASAVFAYLRTAITPGYTSVARNLDGTFNPEATNLLHQLVTRFDVIPTYGDGFSGSNSIRSISESLGKELMTYGSCAMEVVLGKDRLPKRLAPISVTQIQFFQDEKDPRILRPVQLVGSEKIDLDVPTFVYCSLDADLLEPYSTSPLEPALQPVLFAQEFMNDLRKIVKRAIHPRVAVRIDEEQFRKFMPQEAQANDTATADYMNSFISSVQSHINGLNPEDALVYFSTLGITIENGGNTSLSSEYEVLSGLIDAKMATGAKSMPSVLGHGSGSQNVASTESLMFAKAASGAVQEKLNEIYSRALTLSVRLFGFDVYVEFKYNPVDLRPESELEAFKQTKQSRLLELLSLGMITDDQAAIELTGQLPPIGYKPLSGTMFKSKQGAADTNPNGDSNGGSALNQGLTPDTPTQSRGQNKKKNPQGLETESEIEANIQDEPKPEFIAPNITLNVENYQADKPSATVLKMRRDGEGNLIVERLEQAHG